MTGVIKYSRSELQVGVAEPQLRELAELEAAGPEAAEVVPGAEAGEGGHAAQQLREAGRGHARPVHVQALAEAVTACYGEIPLNYCSQSSIFCPDRFSESRSNTSLQF